MGCNTLSSAVLFATAVFLGSSPFAEERDDGFRTGRIENLEATALADVGLDVLAQESDGYVSFDLRMTKDLATLVDKGTVEVDLAIIRDSDIVALLLRSRGREQNWLVSCGSKLRVIIASRRNYRSLEKGLSYLTDFETQQQCS